MKRLMMALLALAACKGDKTEPVAEVTTSADDAAVAVAPVTPESLPDASLQEHMAEHYDKIRVIERSLVIGDLETAKAQAAELAKLAISADMKDYEDEAMAVRAAALSFASDASAETAPMAAAKMAAACGSCHQVRTVITSFEWVPDPSDDGDAKARMQRHLWAMDRLWEGLVGPSDSSWKSGLTVLSTAPFPLSELLADQVPAKVKEELSEDLEIFTAQALKAETLDDKAMAYGALLSTCATCHAARK